MGKRHDTEVNRCLVGADKSPHSLLLSKVHKKLLNHITVQDPFLTREGANIHLKTYTRTKAQKKKTTRDDMTIKLRNHECSCSINEGVRIYYDPRKERRSTFRPTTTKRPVEVHHHQTSSGEQRCSSIDLKKWK
jgi:hypothetical protein